MSGWMFHRVGGGIKNLRGSHSHPNMMGNDVASSEYECTYVHASLRFTCVPSPQASSQTGKISTLWDAHENIIACIRLDQKINSFAMNSLGTTC